MFYVRHPKASASGGLRSSTICSQRLRPCQLPIALNHDVYEFLKGGARRPSEFFFSFCRIIILAVSILLSEFQILFFDLVKIRLKVFCEWEILRLVERLSIQTWIEEERWTWSMICTGAEHLGLYKSCCLLRSFWRILRATHFSFLRLWIGFKYNYLYTIK